MELLGWILWFFIGAVSAYFIDKKTNYANDKFARYLVGFLLIFNGLISTLYYFIFCYNKED